MESGGELACELCFIRLFLNLGSKMNINLECNAIDMRRKEQYTKSSNYKGECGYLLDFLDK